MMVAETLRGKLGRVWSIESGRTAQSAPLETGVELAR